MTSRAEDVGASGESIQAPALVGESGGAESLVEGDAGNEKRTRCDPDIAFARGRGTSSA